VQHEKSPSTSDTGIYMRRKRNENQHNRRITTQSGKSRGICLPNHVRDDGRAGQCGGEMAIIARHAHLIQSFA
jgi:hypothetical protein